jgi:hypothetical protein
VRHENRRELRGLRVLMSWLNNTDARRGNTLDMYVKENERMFLRHHHLDFSASLGSGNLAPKRTRYGHEYVMDPPKIVQSWVTLGFWMKPWENELPVMHRDVGRFESELFDPEKWWPSYANPSFEKMTARDAFWGAKIVTSFTHADLEAIVSEARYEPAARAYVVQTLAARRDKIGRTWFDIRRINPLDNFKIDEAGHLTFEDLAVNRGYADAATTVYKIRIDDNSWQESARPEITIPSTAKKVSFKTCRAKRCSPVLSVTLQTISTGPLQITSLER